MNLPTYLQAVEARFWSRVDKSDECWLWLSVHGTRAERPGSFWLGGGPVRASHLAWRLVHGTEFPNGKGAYHRCGNHSCINPHHILPGTSKDSRIRRRWPPIEERFWAKVRKSEGCWEWTGGSSSLGYGHFNVNRKPMGAHRYVLLLQGVEIPEGMTVDHLCHNPPCVRPDHLRVVTQRENMMNSNGLGALNAVKTHCHKGHAFEGYNLIIRTDGTRACRACRCELHRRYRKRRALSKMEALARG